MQYHVLYSYDMTIYNTLYYDIRPPRLQLGLRASAVPALRRGPSPNTNSIINHNDN